MPSTAQISSFCKSSSILFSGRMRTCGKRRNQANDAHEWHGASLSHSPELRSHPNSDPLVATGVEALAFPSNFRVCQPIYALLGRDDLLCQRFHHLRDRRRRPGVVFSQPGKRHLKSYTAFFFSACSSGWLTRWGSPPQRQADSATQTDAATQTQALRRLPSIRFDRGFGRRSRTNVRAHPRANGHTHVRPGTRRVEHRLPCTMPPAFSPEIPLGMMTPTKPYSPEVSLVVNVSDFETESTLPQQAEQGRTRDLITYSCSVCQGTGALDEFGDQYTLGICNVCLNAFHTDCLPSGWEKPERTSASTASLGRLIAPHPCFGYGSWVPRGCGSRVPALCRQRVRPSGQDRAAHTSKCTRRWYP